MQGIGPLSNLTSLNLQSTRVTDVGFKEICELKELKELKQLYLGNSQVTAKGRSNLRDLLPTLKIIE